MVRDDLSLVAERSECVDSQQAGTDVIKVRYKRRNSKQIIYFAWGSWFFYSFREDVRLIISSLLRKDYFKCYANFSSSLKN